MARAMAMEVGGPRGGYADMLACDVAEDGSLAPLWRSTPSSPSRSRANRIAVAGVAATAAAAGALLLAARPPAGQRLGEALPLGVNGSVALYGEACTDTPDWNNGWSGCAYSKVGKDPTLCKVAPGMSWPATLGYTCKYYEVKGFCKPGQYNDIAMGPGLRSPEQNCCACKGYQPAAACNRDTGGGCKWTGYCNGWRGPTSCEGGTCKCKPGYCTDSIGTCAHSARADRKAEKLAARGVDVGVTDHSCSVDTDDACFMGRGCESWRGAIECKGIKCKCKPGHCIDSLGMCYKHMGEIRAQVHPVNLVKRSFPGPQIQTALAVSGGGCRALSAAFGAFRALRDLGLLPQVDMISSVSGGSWASAILMFADMDLDKLLGPATDPRRLTLAELDQTPAPLGAACMHKTTDIAVKLKLGGVPFGLLWVATVAEAFLTPFNLHRFDSFMALNQQQVQQIKSTNPQYADELFYTPRPGRAKNIVMGSTVEAPNSFKASENNVVFLQAGADFTGSPFYPNSGPVRYDSANLGDAPLTSVLLGGGVVESFAFGGSAPAKRADQMGGEHVALHAPARPFCLARAIGMSSAAFGAQMSSLPGLGGHLNPQVDMWPVSSMQFPRPQESIRFMVGDGGNLENTGLLAMLQRKATRAVSLIDGSDPFDASLDYCSASGYVPTGRELTGQFANFFGYAKTSSSNQQQFHVYNQVFKSEEYLPLLCELRQLQEAGRALTVRRALEVQRNEYWGIEGGWVVDVVFAILGKSASFEALLPAETQAAIAEGPAGGLNGFPGFKTTFLNPPDLTAYTPRQINLLAAQVEWAVHQNQDLWRAVLR